MSSKLICYEVRVAEVLGEQWRGWFPGFKVLPEDGQDRAGSLLRGQLQDQAALFGLLSQIRDLNLTLVEVRLVEPHEKAID